MDNLTSREIDIRGGHALHQVHKIIGQHHISIYFVYNSFIILLERKVSFGLSIQDVHSTHYLVTSLNHFQNEDHSFPRSRR